VSKTLIHFYNCNYFQIQSALSIAFFCVALHPATQTRAQEEIDRVVGTERLPTLEDRESLPYVEALWRETLRWRPALPVGNAHATIADDEYNGYFLPKGGF
jgi:cytochrome P450